MSKMVIDRCLAISCRPITDYVAVLKIPTRVRRPDYPLLARMRLPASHTALILQCSSVKSWGVLASWSQR